MASHYTAPDPDGLLEKRGVIQRSLPVIQNPMTRIGENWFTKQTTYCADLEMDYVRCASRVSMMQAKVECKEFLEDLHECIYHTKVVSERISSGTKSAAIKFNNQ